MISSTNESDRNPTYGDKQPLQPHLDRGTFSGCLGILSVLALPVLLFLPIETWHLPLWLLRLVPLVAVSMAALGAWLLSRVPTSPAARSSDPLHPLTSEGFSPVLEQPARRANRIGLIIVCILIVTSALGYALAAFNTTGVANFIGILLASGAGAALLLYGVLAARHRLTMPAWRWIRIPIQGGLIYQVLPLTLIGMVALVWSLLIAEEQGYIWAPIGIGVLILGGALLGPMMRRLP